MADNLRVDPLVYLRSRREELARTYGITSLRVLLTRQLYDLLPLAIEACRNRLQSQDPIRHLIAGSVGSRARGDARPDSVIGAHARAEAIPV